MSNPNSTMYILTCVIIARSTVVVQPRVVLKGGDKTDGYVNMTFSYTDNFTAC